MKKIAADKNYKVFKKSSLTKVDEVAKLREELEILKRKIKKLEKAEVVTRNKIERHHPAPLGGKKF